MLEHVSTVFDTPEAIADDTMVVMSNPDTDEDETATLNPLFVTTQLLVPKELNVHVEGSANLILSPDVKELVKLLIVTTKLPEAPAVVY